MKTKYLSIPFLLSIVVILGCRIYQIINPTSSSNVEIICFSIASLAVIAIFIINYMIKNITSHIKINKSLAVCIISALSAILITVDSFVRLINYINVYRDIIQFFIGIFGILTGITFAIISISFYKGKNFFESQKFITLFPSIWGILRLLELFFIYNSVSNSPWEMPDEIASIFLLLFLLNQARAFANVLNNKKIKNMFLWGIPSVIFIFSYASLNFTNYLNSSKVFVFDSFITSLADISICIYIILFLFNIITKKNELEINNELNVVKENYITEPTPTFSKAEKADFNVIKPIDKTLEKENPIKKNDEEKIKEENTSEKNDSSL